MNWAWFIIRLFVHVGVVAILSEIVVRDIGNAGIVKLKGKKILQPNRCMHLNSVFQLALSHSC